MTGMTAMQLAFNKPEIKKAAKKMGYRLREKKVTWPRLKGPVGKRIDCSTGYMVDVVR